MNAPSAHPYGGIYAATVCPMTPDARLDERALAAHVASLAAVPGIRGVLCNGHAGENFTLSAEEKRRVVELTGEAAGRAALVVAGVNQESSAEAVAEAREAAAAGADALLVFPPNSWGLSLDRRTVVAHHQAVRAAVELPIMLYQAPVGAGTMAYPPEVLADLVQLPGVVGIKEGSWESATYEANRRLVHALVPEIAVMASGDEHLLSCFVLGSEGAMVSLAILIPETVVALDDAVRRGDLGAARAAHEVIYPLARAIYGSAPAGYATARLKTCLKLMGRLDCDAMRPPIRPLDDGEVGRLRAALAAAALTEPGGETPRRG
jgi:4-hydroxy-tetrahydrodipicolinate synthase